MGRAAGKGPGVKQKTSVGTYGARVAILQRTPGSYFTLRWRDPHTRKYHYRQTEHRVLTKAKEEALELAQVVFAQRQPRLSSRIVTWRRLFSWFEATWAPLAKSEAQRTTDRQELKLWRAILPLDEPVAGLSKAWLTAFVDDRLHGRIVVDGLQLKPRVSNRTVGADLEWLRRAVNLGMGNEEWSLAKNPVLSVDIPKNPRPKHPIASDARYEAVRAHADAVGSQGLFGGFLDLLQALGWRVTAICRIRLEHIDRQGLRWRIWKDRTADKEGVEGWLPVSDWLQPRLSALLEARKALGATGPWLFPQVTNPDRSWDRYYARARLETAEKLAKLAKLDGGDFHPYRRLWATRRKHLPLVDVAFAGGWSSPAMLTRIYQQVDEATLLKVMNT